MKNLFKISILAGLFIAFAVSVKAQTKYKCMVQMNAYNGEEAYIVVSLIGPKGDYQKTLYMMGKEKKWYNTLKEWFKSTAKKGNKIDGKTGASVAGGDRAMAVLEIDDKLLDKNYKLRFESAVEDQKYVVDDVEVPLTASSLADKTEGKGYIKYVRFSKVQL